MVLENFGEAHAKLVYIAKDEILIHHIRPKTSHTHTHTHTKVQRPRHPSQADENLCADSLTNKREDNVMETFTTPLQSETDQEETVDEHVKVRLQITIVCDCCVCSAVQKKNMQD